MQYTVLLMDLGNNLLQRDLCNVENDLWIIIIVLLKIIQEYGKSVFQFKICFGSAKQCIIFFYDLCKIFSYAYKNGCMCMAVMYACSRFTQERLELLYFFEMVKNKLTENYITVVYICSKALF